MYCFQCGEELVDGAKFCHVCGANQEEARKLFEKNFKNSSPDRPQHNQKSAGGDTKVAYTSDPDDGEYLKSYLNRVDTHVSENIKKHETLSGISQKTKAPKDAKKIEKSETPPQKMRPQKDARSVEGGEDGKNEAKKKSFSDIWNRFIDEEDNPYSVFGEMADRMERNEKAVSSEKEDMLRVSQDLDEDRLAQTGDVSSLNKKVNEILDEQKTASEKKKLTPKGILRSFFSKDTEDDRDETIVPRDEHVETSREKAPKVGNEPKAEKIAPRDEHVETSREKAPKVESEPKAEKIAPRDEHVETSREKAPKVESEPKAEKIAPRDEHVETSREKAPKVENEPKAEKIAPRDEHVETSREKAPKVESEPKAEKIAPRDEHVETSREKAPKVESEPKAEKIAPKDGWKNLIPRFKKKKAPDENFDEKTPSSSKVSKKDEGSDARRNPFQVQKASFRLELARERVLSKGKQGTHGLFGVGVLLSALPVFFAFGGIGVLPVVFVLLKTALDLFNFFFANNFARANTCVEADEDAQTVDSLLHWILYLIPATIVFFILPPSFAMGRTVLGSVTPHILVSIVLYGWVLFLALASAQRILPKKNTTEFLAWYGIIFISINLIAKLFWIIAIFLTSTFS